MTMNILFLSLLLSLHVILYANTNENKKGMKLAFCVSGQLARFEIVSKIKNVFVANTLIGHHVDVFILLDPDVKEVKQTFWRFDYSTNTYNDMTSDELKKHVEIRPATWNTTHDFESNDRFNINKVKDEDVIIRHYELIFIK